ncbi:PREDICTED: uncharacterized protein LOC106748065, partial [Dinoponera quadriceps]|uniref:Uncharacterized protein LOC106748065 n=1 Tax=Dinoponera quadriceps TaxID=609295 RepID=A0A6P3XUB8_DINQU
MVKTVQAALSPLLVVGAFCGLCVFEFPLGRPRPYLTCLYFLVTWSIYAYIVYYLIDIAQEQIIFLSWTNLTITISSFVSMLVNIFRCKELKKCLRKLSIVDDTLEVLGTPKEYRPLYKWMIGVIITWSLFSIVDDTLEVLGTPKEYRPLYKWMIGVIITWCVTANLLNVLDILWQHSKGTKGKRFDVVRICTPLVENHLLHLGNINGVMLGTVLGYTASRFERVNKHIYNLLENNAEHAGKRNTLILVGQKRVLEESEKRGQRFWIIMHVHLQLSMLSRQLNKVFNVQMTLEMATLFAVLVDQFFDFHHIYVDENRNLLHQIVAKLTTYIWTGLFTAKLFALNYICQTICDK